MTKKKKKEFESLSVNELSAKVAQYEADLFQTRMKQKTGQLTDVSQIWRLRKDLARVKTLITQKAVS